MDIFRLAENDPLMARKRSYLADFGLKIVDIARSVINLDELAVEFKFARQTTRNWGQAERS